MVPFEWTHWHHWRHCCAIGANWHATGANSFFLKNSIGVHWRPMNVANGAMRGTIGTIQMTPLVKHHLHAIHVGANGDEKRHWRHKICTIVVHGAFTIGPIANGDGANGANTASD